MKSGVMYLTVFIVCALGMTACAGGKDRGQSVQPEAAGTELREDAHQEGMMTEPGEESGQGTQGPESEEGPGLSTQGPESGEGPGLSTQEPESGEGPGLSTQEPESKEGPEQENTEQGGQEPARESGMPEESDGGYGIRFDEAEQTYQAEDGTELLNVQTRFPVVTIPGHEQAAEAINQYVRSTQIFSGEGLAGISEEEALQWAEEDYKIRGKDNWYTEYMLYNGYGLQRMDDSVVSFVLETYSYMGGAHPNTVLHGLTFDTQTGERLTFADVAEKEEEASEAVLQFLLEETGKEEYQGAFFDGYEESLGDLLREDTWYLGEDGFHIIANTYAIAPYVAGSFDFVIPYKQADFLKERFLKEELDD